MREFEPLPVVKAGDRVGRVPLWLFAAVVFVLYVAAALAAWHLFRVGPIAAIWPPAAVALAAFVFGGWWMVPVVFLADAAATLLNGLPFAPFVHLGNLVGPMVGAAVFRSLAGPTPVPQTVRDTARLLLIVAPLVAALTTVFGLIYTAHADVLRGFSTGFLAVAWWFGDVLGLAAFTPLLIALVARLGGLALPEAGDSRAGFAEGLALLGLLSVLAVLPWFPAAGEILQADDNGAGVQLVVQLLLVLFVLMIWSALRLPMLKVLGVVAVAVLTGLKFSLVLLSVHAGNDDLVQWLVLLPTLLVMAAVTLLIESGTRERLFIQRRLEFRSDHDSLTGLPNRRALERHVRHALDRTDSKTPWLLGYLDLDRFQMINDTLGHTVGDELLVQLADRLASALGPGEMIARLGGDEFGLLIRGPWRPDGRERMEHLQDAIESFRFNHSGQVFSLRASIGVTELAGDPSEFGLLLSVADAACLHAKEQGRDRVNFSQGRDQVRRQIDELRKIPLIQDALDRSRIELYGQSLVKLDAAAGERALEVLCRLRDEDGGLVAPEAFIEVAERSGLMPQIDRLVVAKVLDWLEHCDDPPDRCFINLSAASIANQRFVDELIERIERRTVDPRRLVFEMTETAAVGNYRAARRFIEQLRAMGAGVALDDFGSGMSSFGHLQALPVDFVKIDAVFVQNLGKGFMNEAIVRSIAQIGRDCGILTVAEGVEDAESLALLRRHGIDYAQGFHLGRPAPLEGWRALHD